MSEACASLAQQMNADAEATKQADRQGRSHRRGGRPAQAVAESQLTKCSWYGEDPYWGRVASDLGSAGVRFDPELVQICYGDTVVARRGWPSSTTSRRSPSTSPSGRS